MEDSLQDGTQGTIIQETQVEASMPQLQRNLSFQQPASRRASPTLGASASRRPSPTFTTTTTAPSTVSAPATVTAPAPASLQPTNTSDEASVTNGEDNDASLFSPPFGSASARRLTNNNNTNDASFLSPPFGGDSTRRLSDNNNNNTHGGRALALFSSPLPGASIEPPPLPSGDAAGTALDVGVENDDQFRDHHFIDGAFNQQLYDDDRDPELGVGGGDINNNATDTAFTVDTTVPFEWSGISPDIILAKLKLLKPEVHEPCGLRPFYKSYGKWETMTADQRNKAVAWFRKLSQEVKGILLCFIISFLM
jgi:hypothetical protein